MHRDQPKRFANRASLQQQFSFGQALNHQKRTQRGFLAAIGLGQRIHQKRLPSLGAENANRVIGIKPLKSAKVVASLDQRQRVHLGAPIRFAGIATEDRDLHIVRFIDDPDSVKVWLFAAVGLEMHDELWNRECGVVAKGYSSRLPYSSPRLGVSDQRSVDCDGLS
jgi:hypothetical protein